MAKTIKVVGMGPLAGQAFYGEVHSVAADRCKLLLDDSVCFGELGKLQHFTFDRDSGALVAHGGKTNLLCIDQLDMPRLDEAIVLGLGDK